MTTPAYDPQTPAPPAAPEPTDQQTASAGAQRESEWMDPVARLLFRLILGAILLLITLAIIMVVVQFVVLGHKAIQASERDVALTVVLPAAPEAAQTASAAGDQAPADAAAPGAAAGSGAETIQLEPTQAAEIERQVAAQTLLEADQAKQDAQDSVNAVSMLLSFLEGTAVLAGLSLGAAAYFGFRNSRETRDDIKAEVDRVHDLETELETSMDQQQSRIDQRIDEIVRTNASLQETVSEKAALVDHYREPLTQLPVTISNFEHLRSSVNQTLDEIRVSEVNLRQLIFPLQNAVREAHLVFADLLQANQELTLRNFNEAYSAVMRVLTLQKENPLALYMAGWIEFQYIPNQLDEGIEHLKRALELAPDWPSAMAAYGVVLRRRALQLAGPEREAMLAEAEGHLRKALVLNPNLLDLNFESFWGPVAGILRDKEEFDKAILAYEQACRVTPGSSYPHGNLAALYLGKSNAEPKLDWLDKALALFEKTARLAESELSTKPNDYYHIMDIAMSRLMLTQIKPDQRAEAEEKFQEALGVQPTPEMLAVSQRGWRFLVDHCPDDWTELRGRLSTALDWIGTALESAQKEAEQ